MATLLITEALQDAGWTINEYAASIGIGGSSIISWNRLGIPADRQDHLRRVVGEAWWQRFIGAGLTKKKRHGRNNMNVNPITEALQDAGRLVSDYSASIGLSPSTVTHWNVKGIPIDHQDHLRGIVGEVWWQRLVDAGLTEKKSNLVTLALRATGWTISEYAVSIGLTSGPISTWNNSGIPLHHQENLRSTVGEDWWQRFVDAGLTEKRARRSSVTPKLVTEALQDAGWTVNEYAESVGVTIGAVSPWNERGIPIHHQENLRSTVGEDWWQRLVDAGLTDKRARRSRGVGGLRSRSLDDALKNVRMDVAVHLYCAAKDERVDFRDVVLKCVAARDDFADIKRVMHESRLEDLKARSANALHEGRYDEAIRLAQELKELEAEGSGEVTLREILDMG